MKMLHYKISVFNINFNKKFHQSSVRANTISQKGLQRVHEACLKVRVVTDAPFGQLTALHLNVPWVERGRFSFLQISNWQCCKV